MKTSKPRIDRSPLAYADLRLGWLAMIQRQVREPLVRRHLGLGKAAGATSFAKILGKVSNDVLSLWEGFTTERASVSRYLTDPKRALLPYLVGFHLPNAVRAAAALERARQRLDVIRILKAYMARNTKPEVLHVTDVGSGTGAMIQMWTQAWGPKDLRVELIEARSAFSKQCEATLNHLGVNEVKSFRSFRDFERSHVILCGYFLNEILRNKAERQKFLTALIKAGKHSAPKLLMLIEPANQHLARAMMEWRDELLESWHPLYPCPHQDACPMRERSRDWCYSEFMWTVGPEMQAVDRLLDINHQRLGAAAYIFTNEALWQLAKNELKPLGAVVVGRPQVERAKATFSYLLCQKDGRLGTKPSKGGKTEVLRGLDSELS